MKANNINTISITFLIALTTAACGGAGAVTNGATSDAGDDALANLEELYNARRQAAKMSFTDADVEFMTGMIGHHAQALIMSRLAPENGASGQVRILTSRIINAQQDEISLMQTWLRDRGQPVPEVHIDGLNLMLHGAGDHEMMPGMLSQDQLNELSEAQGEDFDRLFLTYMIQHHTGAVTMVEVLFAAGGGGQDEATFKVASDINVDQITEIARMRLMIEAIDESTN
jgi:uncharacterized protein (DUF305 family)